MRTILAALLLAASTASLPLNVPAPFPSRLEKYFKDVGVTAEEQKRLTAGEPMTKFLAADESKEVAVLGAIWINVPMRRYADAVKDIENFEKGGGFKVTKRISAPPKIEDFAQLQLPPDDVTDLRGCQVNECEVKLGEEALGRFRSQVDWKAADANVAANKVMRQLALEYATRYLEGGNDRLAVYRDQSRPTFVAQEFRAMIDAMPQLTTYMPDVRKHLLEYPKANLPSATNFLYWQETEFGLKPTIRISHVMVREGPEDTVVTSKMLYASHYFWTGLELRVLTPDSSRGPGFWLVTVHRSRADGLSGTSGRLLRGRVKSEVQEGTLAGLRRTKESLEKR